jgi:undecaprenyl phosphate-alpha-L-ara4N flippase subunit ArnF
MIGYIYIIFTLLFTVYGQLILKWRLSGLSFQLPDGVLNKLISLLKIIFDPYIFSGFVSAFAASLFWMAAMTQFEITKAYPFMSLAPALVFLFGIALLGEVFTWGKLIRLIFIMVGIFITVKL